MLSTQEAVNIPQLSQFLCHSILFTILPAEGLWGTRVTGLLHAVQDIIHLFDKCIY